MSRYRVVIWWSDEDQAFIGSVPALRGCVSHGGTREECLHELAVVEEAWLELAAEQGWAIPAPDTDIAEAA